MCFIRVLVLLSAVIVCTDSSITSGAGPETEAPASTASLTTPDIFTGVQTTTNTPQPQTTITTTPQTTTIAVDPASASTQTSDITEGADSSTLSMSTMTEQTSEETVSQGSTLSAASISTNVTVAAITTNTTESAPSPDWEKSDLEANPGLVAVICIFCVIFALVLLVAAVKCIWSPRSNFERLEDVPLGKVSEESPFAQYSK